MRRPTPSHGLNAYCTLIVWVSYGYGYTRGSGRVWVEIFGAGRVRVRVASSATGTGRVAEMVDPHTPSMQVILPSAFLITSLYLNLGCGQLGITGQPLWIARLIRYRL